MIIYSIYKIVNSINGKVYIGYTKNYTKRLNEHCQDSKRHHSKFYNAINKHGWENFTHDILYQSLDINHAKEMEIYFISEYNSYRKGYNSTPGGEGGGKIVSDNSKKKMSISRRGRFIAKDSLGNTYQITKDDPRYISGELVGINKGKKTSAETSKKLSAALIGNQRLLGYKHTEKSKKLIGEGVKRYLNNR